MFFYEPGQMASFNSIGVALLYDISLFSGYRSGG